MNYHNRIKLATKTDKAYESYIEPCRHSTKKGYMEVQLTQEDFRKLDKYKRQLNADTSYSTDRLSFSDNFLELSEFLELSQV